MELTEKTLRSELIFDGRVVHLYRDEVELPDGGTSVREYIKHVGAVCVLPLTDDGKIVLERQYRYPFSRVLVEIPAGKLDHADEDLREAALRELREETGIVPRELIDLGDYYGSSAIMGERIRMFFARGLSFGEQQLDSDEFLEVFTMPFEEALGEVMAGNIPDGKTQLAILKVRHLLEKEGKRV